MDFSKYLGEIGLAELWNLMLAHVNSRLFIGTRAEYEAKINEIPIGAIVIITDESEVVLPPVVEQPDPEPQPPVEEEKPSKTTAILGAALLNQMILGQSK